ncbi:hypothetical protein [Candidatus Ferrigenium straubiae]|jgi:hypothetical protein|uniref:hypothetical protein n=1 Tax=Candidatus Ferrigenium straubiae TaxID=2919506 RepID=UPI003F4ABFA7
MKPNKLIATLIAAALLPASVYVSADEITTGFERGMYRGMYCGPSASTVVITQEAAAKTDPMEEEVNALVNSTSDPVLASYYRDLYRAPAAFEAAEFVRTPDPYMDAISIALWGKTERGTTHIC